MAKKPNYQQISANLDRALAPKRRPDRLDSLLSEYEDAPAGAQLPDIAGAHQPPAVDTHQPQSAGAHNPESVSAQPEVASANAPTNYADPSANAPTKISAGAHQRTGASAHKKERRSGNRVRNNIWIDRELDKQIRRFAIDHDLMMNQFFEIAGAHFLECAGARQSFEAGANAPHDDLKIFRSKIYIINLYRKIIGRKWTLADDRVAVQFNDMDERVLEVTLYETLGKFRYSWRNSPGKTINSFKYFEPELREALRQIAENYYAMDSIDARLKLRREQWAETEGKR